MGTHPGRNRRSALGCSCSSEGKPGVKFNYPSKPPVSQRAITPPTHRQTLGFTNLISGGFLLEAELQEIMGCFEVGIILRWNPTINAKLLHPASKSLQERGLCTGTTPQTSSFFTQNCLVLIHPPQDHSWCSQSIPVLGGGCSTWSRALNSRNPTFHRGKTTRAASSGSRLTATPRK